MVGISQEDYETYFSGYTTIPQEETNYLNSLSHKLCGFANSITKKQGKKLKKIFLEHILGDEEIKTLEELKCDKKSFYKDLRELITTLSDDDIAYFNSDKANKLISAAGICFAETPEGLLCYDKSQVDWHLSIPGIEKSINEYAIINYLAMLVVTNMHLPRKKIISLLNNLKPVQKILNRYQLMRELSKPKQERGFVGINGKFLTNKLWKKHAKKFFEKNNLPYE